MYLIFRCNRTEKKGNYGDHAVGPFQPMKDDGDHTIGSAQSMKALGKFVTRNFILQMKDRGGGHFILLVGEVCLMKISNLLQHKLQSSHKDRRPLNFHFGFLTQNTFTLSLLPLCPVIFILPRYRYCARCLCHSMHIFVLS